MAAGDTTVGSTPFCFVDGSIQVDRFAAYLDVGLIHPPGAAHPPGVPLPPLLEFRRVMLHPSHNRRVGHPNATFAHHADQIPVAQLETQIPPNTQHHNLGIEMATREQFISWNKSGHFLIFAAADDFCTRAVRGG